MVEPLGHVAVALAFALPAWILWDGRTGAAFVGFVLLASTLPDIDIVLMRWGFPIKHHGFTHTILFVLGVALVAGALAIAVLAPMLERWWRLTEDESVNRGTVELFVVGGLSLGGVSHLFGDMISNSSYEPIEPLWPLVGTHVQFAVAHYSSVWLNGVLFVAVVAIHLAIVASGVFPLEHRYRRWRATLTDDDAPGGTN
jgi:membrane-bound metal-dependent hydrolase YbcI (DUF457 family)